MNNEWCVSCKFWSHRYMALYGSGPLKALCLCHKSKNKGSYTIAMDSCNNFIAGRPIDKDNSGRNMNINQDKKRWRVWLSALNIDCIYLYFPRNDHACENPENKDPDKDRALCTFEYCPLLKELIDDSNINME